MDARLWLHAAEIEAGRFSFDEALEDIHMNIEARLSERIGEAGRRLHTARSRNDQIALDVRLWVRDARIKSVLAIRELMLSLVELAEKNDLVLGAGKVLVNGATGGVASLCIDMLSRLGYSVTALTGKAAEKDYLTSLGAAEVLEGAE